MGICDHLANKRIHPNLLGHLLLKPSTLCFSSKHLKRLTAVERRCGVNEAPEALNEDTPIVAETPALDAALTNVAIPQKEPKKKGRKPIPGCYQRQDIIHDLPEHQKPCSCGCALSKIGEDVSEQLDVIPAQI